MAQRFVSAAIGIMAITLMGTLISGCNEQDGRNAVQHKAGWQQQAGQSPREAARLAKQSQENTGKLQEAIASGNPDPSQWKGKLVSMNGQVSDQNDSAWTLACDGGWTCVAQVDDLTPNSSMSKDHIAKCGAQGVIAEIDTQHKRIVLADAELAPIALPANANTIVSK